MDFLSDNNNIILDTVLPLLHGLSKTASTDSTYDETSVAETKEALRQEVAKYPSTLFVKQASREYPCANRLQTTLSYAYAAYAEGGDKAVCAPLRKVAGLLGCEALLDGVDTLYVEDTPDAETILRKSASAEEGYYALVIGDKKNYPAENRMEVAESVMKLSRDLDRMPVFHSRVAARNLVKRASATGLATDTTVFPAGILKRAEQRMPAQDGIDLVRKQRSSRYSENAMSVLEQVLTKVAAATIDSILEAETMVAQIEKMDAAASIKYNHPASRISDPYASIFRGPRLDMVKSAAEQMVRVEPANGKPCIVHVTRAQEAAASAPPADFLSADVGDFLQKMASVSSAAEANILIATASDASVSLLAQLLGTSR